MATQSYFQLGLLLVLFSCVSAHLPLPVIPPTYSIASFNRSSFPKGFLLGLGSSAFQFEGATTEGGRGQSTWEAYFQKNNMPDGELAKVAVDQYHRYKEDVAIMKSMGLDTYRMSISWPRILPNGKLSGGVNPEGIKYYNNLFNELLANGIQPFVTLFHWDLPQHLEEEYEGFLSPKIVDDFRDYAKVCFENFGDKVKNWATINEPEVYSRFGYSQGFFAPGRCSKFINPNCTKGNSATEPYMVMHNQLLAHATAVKLYREHFKKTQKGQIGISTTAEWYEPLTDTKQDRKAVRRMQEFNTGWTANPLTKGDYPQIMKSIVGDRLPKFTKKQSKLLKGSFDFLGLNYYTSYYASNMKSNISFITNPTFETDHHVTLSNDRNGVLIGETSASSWINYYPKGLHYQLVYMAKKYNAPKMYVTENGMDEMNNATIPLAEALNDVKRVRYTYHHLESILKAINDGANVNGYMGWSFVDSLGWIWGYSMRSGFNFVDFNNGLTRYPKLSAHWFKEFLKVRG